ncbi:MAG: hypothetical protein A2402_01910 [Candidatus Staskawiczbacteria bacterium RIFOXYC1_FULL_37_43]|uniref:Glycosyltransferase subfamily 4-like N-terminal domain-containing protein n=1 Tax=Candidatus Nomurabacteria bacterium RIFOXYA1_FULL_35_17 TaxID=1801798 RepID=A0A1F6YHL8_9BACT|nr:MAG: hypothetical protein A2192_01395 [Candidatus Nomurabacteria bacterium RIFOXYA1_FULL_35_17]OGZ63523.1 MAG: hypothetical protein A2813_00265 [Candidatus Staskawiczbacteria bacterium RIFCSPHIGHO2_01_FULL_37_17]OGZ71383.1 MAG: hypothetical protein A2891_02250 [Candidatus Staskawiczbacteria bacterium RIFCSPLOWO2_01_FULL_37_19]OGZ77728.1 MAG: hypothetical protein A2280_00795 [Candidatus Staskawiczbacteria bacterium RIFOXYA12_FULL_37_10]OGZ80776.1 MAG: hypothetical protein A2353_00860 [Candida
MKILTNIRFAQTAGISQVLISFIKFIEKSKKNNLSIVGVNIIGKRKNESYRRAKKGNVKIISAGFKRIPNIAKVVKRVKTLDEVANRYCKVISAYRKAIKEENPDVVLVNGTYYMPWCLFLAARLEKAPVVLHYHGVLAKETEGWKKKQKKMFKKMEQSFDKKGVFYIFPSKITKKVVEEEVFGHKIRKYAVLPNPVPLHFFNKKANPPAGGGNKNIGIVSRWTRIKNVKFIGEFAEYNKKNGKKFNINLITDVPFNTRHMKKLSKKVKLHKPRNNKKLADFYNKMDVIISPSHFETYGNVAKEAVASGTPALVNTAMGVGETFKKLGLNNFVTNFDSIEKVYAKIESVIGKNIEKTVRDKIKELYSPRKIFNDLVDILELAV